MGTKVKGLLKGLRYISQIFDEEKEKEIQIGFPTDVKHVAHIGWDGQSTDNPSWMKEFNGSAQFQSAPLVPPGDPKENPEIKWVSEDSNRRSRDANSSSSTGDQPEQPKSSRRHSSKEHGGTDSPKRDSSKSWSSRRHHRKDSADGSKHGHIQLDSAAGSESPARDLPDIPKKSRRKKSKESVPGGSAPGSRSSKSKETSSSTAPPSDPGSRLDPGSECSVQSSTNCESIIS